MSNEDAALAACAAGFTIWLTVRIMNRREKWVILIGIAWAIILGLGWLLNLIAAYEDSIG